MPNEQQQPEPGTWGAVVRSETAMPWRRMFDAVTFTPAEIERRLADGTFVKEQIRRVKKAFEMMP